VIGSAIETVCMNLLRLLDGRKMCAIVPPIATRSFLSQLHYLWLNRPGLFCS